MRYLGGKSKTRKRIAAYINNVKGCDQAYWEPFVGGGWVLARVAGNKLYASDSNEYLISMWQALQDRWVPPSEVSEAEYKAAKQGKYMDKALTAFIWFGCSFGDIWCSGYARDKKVSRNFAREAKDSLLNKIKMLAPTIFFQADFLTYDPPEDAMFIYCDPPYGNTSGYDAVGKFDSALFWSRVRDLEALGHTCLISEYTAPEDFTCVVTMKSRMGLRNKDKQQEIRTEKLFRLGNPQPEYPLTFGVF